MIDNTIIYAWDNALWISNTSLILPFNVVCISNGIVGVSDGKETYFYNINGIRLEPLDISIRSIAHSCDYEFPYLVVSTPFGTNVIDLRRGVLYSFPGATLGASCGNEGFVIYEDRSIEVHSNKRTSKYSLNSIVTSLKCKDGLIVACEGSNVLVISNGDVTEIPFRCEGVDVSRKYVAVYNRGEVELYDLNLKRVASLRLPYTIKEVRVGETLLAVLTSRGIYIYRIVGLRRDVVSFVLFVLLIGSLITVSVKLLKEYRL